MKAVEEGADFRLFLQKFLNNGLRKRKRWRYKEKERKEERGEEEISKAGRKKGKVTGNKPRKNEGMSK